MPDRRHAHHDTYKNMLAKLESIKHTPCNGDGCTECFETGIKQIEPNTTQKVNLVTQINFDRGGEVTAADATTRTET